MACYETDSSYSWWPYTLNSTVPCHKTLQCPLDAQIILNPTTQPHRPLQLSYAASLDNGTAHSTESQGCRGGMLLIISPLAWTRLKMTDLASHWVVPTRRPQENCSYPRGLAYPTALSWWLATCKQLASKFGWESTVFWSPDLYRQVKYGLVSTWSPP